MNLLIDTVASAAIILGALAVGRAVFCALGKATKELMRGRR